MYKEVLVVEQMCQVGKSVLDEWETGLKPRQTRNGYKLVPLYVPSGTGIRLSIKDVIGLIGGNLTENDFLKLVTYDNNFRKNLAATLLLEVGQNNPKTWFIGPLDRESNVLVISSELPIGVELK